MSKRKDTLAIEQMLTDDTRGKRIYGCEEVTIGFINAGMGNEICDFMTMDSKGIIRCYEIKVTLADLKSDAKKSWHGHYNYLAVSPGLYREKDKWEALIPDDVGIIVGGASLSSARHAKKRDISAEKETMLKESLLRTLYWKMDKYRKICDPGTVKGLKSELRKMAKRLNAAQESRNRAESIIETYERFRDINEGLVPGTTCLQEMAEKERMKWQEARIKRLRESVKEQG